MNEWPLPGELPDSNLPSQEAPSLVPSSEFPFWGYRDLAVVLALFVVVLVCLMIVSALLVVMYPRVFGAVPKPLLLILQQAFVYGVGLASLYAVISLRHGRPFWDSMRWQATPANLRMAAAAGVGTAIAGTLLAYLFGAQNMEDMPMQDMLSSRAVVAVVGLLAVTIGPLWEELTFRGFLLPLVSKSFGNTAGVLVAAFPFALMHGPQYGWAWQALVPVGFAGVCFGVARVITGSTSVATAMHSIYNLTIFAGFLAQGGIDKLP